MVQDKSKSHDDYYYWEEEAPEDGLLPSDGAESPTEGFYQYYDTLEILGKGLSSVVRRCVEKATGQEYAVKIMDVTDTKHLSSEGLTIREQVYREIEILRSVHDHVNIVTLHDVFETATNMFLVFELCVNGELFDYLNNSVVLSEKKCRQIIKQILEAVNYCHEKFIVHRDLKPENILLDANNNIKLTDFGFAKVVRPDERLYETCGTPGYLAPEVLKAGMFERDECDGYNIEVDAWACGVILYTMCVGTPPFFHRRQINMIRMILEGRYSLNTPDWKNVTDETKDLISSLLTVDPKKRISIKGALNHKAFLHLNENKFDPKKTFRIAITCVRFLIRFKRLRDTPEPLSMYRMRTEPYSMRVFRENIDDKAFNIYSHWVNRGERQNRGTLFEHFPKKECLRRQILNFTNRRGGKKNYNPSPTPEQNQLMT